MKFFQILQKIKQYLPYFLWYVGLLLGLYFVIVFFNYFVRLL